METRFYYRELKNTTKGMIYFSFTTLMNGKLRISTTQKIETKLWNDGYPKRNSQTTEIRNVLDNYKSMLDDFIKVIIKREEREPTKYEFSRFIDEMINGKEVEHIKTIKYYVDEFLRDDAYTLSEDTKRLKRSHLDHFVKIIGIRKSVIDLNKEEILSYKVKLKSEDDRQITTTNNYIKNVKSFLKWLWEKDYISSDVGKYLKKDPEILKDVIALTEEEFKIIETANLKEINLQDQLDIFLFGCYTTLSIGDIKRVKKEMINDNYLVLRRSKNNSDQKIPLIPQAITLLEKHNYKLPHIADNKGSENLKKAFKKLNLNRKVRISIQPTKGKVIDQYKELYKIISWHKSRKTGITTLLSKDVNLSMLMQISGHKKTTTVQRYIDFSKKDLTAAMNKMRS